MERGCPQPPWIHLKAGLETRAPIHLEAGLEARAPFRGSSLPPTKVAKKY